MNLRYFIAQMAPQFFDWTICRHTFLLLYSQTFRRNYSVMHLNLKYIHVFAKSWLRCFLFGGFVNLNDSYNYQNTFYLQGYRPTRLDTFGRSRHVICSLFGWNIFSRKNCRDEHMFFFYLYLRLIFPNPGYVYEWLYTGI